MLESRACHREVADSTHTTTLGKLAGMCLCCNVVLARVMMLCSWKHNRGLEERDNCRKTAKRLQGHQLSRNAASSRPVGVLYLFYNVCEQQFNNPHLLYEEPWRGMDMMLRGFVGDSSQTCDQFVANQITHNLFTENPPRGLGEDLATLNIQRGRDHGIPG